ncbi:MAG: hypothetical protein U0234_19250 [Sandaracinus sp.]
MRLVLWGTLAALAGVCGCTTASSNRPDSGSAPDMGTGATDVGADTSSMSCTNDGQCADAFDCTIDQCVAGNVCMHTPIDATCNVAAGEHCSITLGCTTTQPQTCNTDADCDDHHYCNGDEHCAGHTCLISAPRDCDDGNACTIDACDDTIAHCTYQTTCDAGMPPTDTGPVCTPFTAPDGFNGTFFVAPAQNQGCGVTMYTLSRIVLTVSGSTATATGLVIQGGGVTMTGTVTGNSFDVSYAGCGNYHLTGTFGSCRETFTGHWSATYGGGSGCGTCTTMNADITGLRSGS